LSLMPVSCIVSGGGAVPALSPVRRGEGKSGITKAVYCRSTKLYLLFADGYMHISGNGLNFTEFLNVSAKSPFVLDVMRDGKAYAALVFGKTATRLTTDGFDGVALGENLISGVLHCGRLFGVTDDGLRVCWSECGVEDWSDELNGGGSVYLGLDRGETLGILELGENLVAVRRYGLTLLAMYGSPENFSVKLTDTGTDEIIPETAKVVEGKLYFCTKTGVCVFDGEFVSKLSHRFESEIEECYFAESYAGGYYLSCKIASFGKVLLCIEPDGKESYVIDVEADATCVSDKLYVYNEEGVYSLESGGGYSLIATGVDFGTGLNKTVTELYADSENCGVEINNGLFSRRFSNVNGAVRPSLRGRKFNVIISGSEPLKGLTLTAEVSVGI
ncbi:MAG: hypothetical protein K2J83_04380, partial [Clostridia bacterium]|nr:hypothetical protein [Clostridia bacterium]